MRRTSREFHELQTQFEKDVEKVPFEKMPFYAGAAATRSYEKGEFYTNGMLNNLFWCYMCGYQYAKCKARQGDLPHEE